MTEKPNAHDLANLWVIIRGEAGTDKTIFDFGCEVMADKIRLYAPGIDDQTVEDLIQYEGTPEGFKEACRHALKVSQYSPEALLQYRRRQHLLRVELMLFGIVYDYELSIIRFKGWLKTDSIFNAYNRNTVVHPTVQQFMPLLRQYPEYRDFANAITSTSSLFYEPEEGDMLVLGNDKPRALERLMRETWIGFNSPDIQWKAKK